MLHAALGLPLIMMTWASRSLEKFGTTLRDETLGKSENLRWGIILGTQSHADYPAPEKGGRNVSAGFRIGLDLYANVRPARTRFPAFQHERREVDGFDRVRRPRAFTRTAI